MASPGVSTRWTSGGSVTSGIGFWDSRSAATGLRALIGAGGATVAAFWWLDTAGGSVAGPAQSVTAAGRLIGLMGAYLVLVQILLMARLPWFERAVGLTRLAAWHRNLGTGVVTLLVLHVLLIVEGYSLTEHRDPVHESWTITSTYPDMVKALLGLGLFLLVGATSGARLRARLSFEAWYWLHLTAYLAVALTFFHQISSGADFVGSDLQHRAARFLWIAGYVGVGAAIGWWRLVRPVRGWLRHRLIVDAVVPEADGVVSVYLRGRDTAALGRPGQFLSVRFLTPGHFGSAHPYSLSAPPGSSRLRLTVKAAGDHSADLHRLRPGVPVLAEGPFGRFTADRVERRHVLLIAGGSGIAPIRALAEELTDPRGVRQSRRHHADVVVLYRASTRDDLALAHELHELAGAGRIRLHLVVGRRSELGYDPLAPAGLQHFVPDLGRRDIFTCGPSGMVSTVTDSLLQLRVPPRQHHVEEFDL